MDFRTYARRAHATATYVGKSTGSDAAINYCLVGLAGEVGEALNKWKKYLRKDSFGQELEQKVAISGELGDILWYTMAAAHELGIDLEAVAQNNLSKLEGRKERGVIKGDGDNR